MKKLIIYSAVVLAALSSCSSDDEYAGIGDKFAGNVVLSAEGYEFEGGTRTSLTNTGSAIEFAWKNGEAIGVFPIAPTTNNQAKQVIETKGEGTSAVFNGAGWALLKGNTYAAYSPYSNMSSDVSYSAIPVDMTGQTQIGNASLAHIGDKYDYMYASVSIPTEGNVSFDFKHVGSIVMLNMKAPASATWSKFTLANKAGNKVFTTNATMNVSNGEITSVTKSDAISLDLTNISTTLDDVITLYMSVLPATTGELTATLTDSEGKEYVATLESKTLVAGKAYRFYIDEFVYSIPDFIFGYLYVSDESILTSDYNSKFTSLASYLNNHLTLIKESNGTKKTFTDSYIYNGQSEVVNCFVKATSYPPTLNFSQGYSAEDFTVTATREDDDYGAGVAFVLVPSSWINGGYAYPVKLDALGSTADFIPNGALNTVNQTGVTGYNLFSTQITTILSLKNTDVDIKFKQGKIN